MKKVISRREFLYSSGMGAGLFLAATVTPRGTALFAATVEQAQSATVFSPSVWLSVTPDDVVTVMISKSEMGQGTSTGLPMIVAEELGADWKTVRFQQSPARPEYNDPVWNMQITGGSTGIRHFYELMRKTGAAAREMLIQAAAQQWGVPAQELQAVNGAVVHGKNGRSLTFGQLCGQAAQLAVPQEPKLKDEASFTFIGKPLPRLDIPDKVNGSARFGADIFLDGMLYGAVARPPRFGAQPVSYDEKAALRVKGVRKVVPLSDHKIGVVAETITSAWKGRDALSVQWSEGAAPGLNNDSIRRDLMGSLERPGLTAKKVGDVDKGLASASKTLDTLYELPYLAHATMAPMNCVANVKKDSVELWVPTQFQTGCLQAVSKLTGLDETRITLHTTFLGGGFGRRTEATVVTEAAQLSGAAGSPVKLQWTREDDMRHDVYRPAAVCAVQAGIDDQGTITVWRNKIAVQSIFERFNPAFMRDGVDRTAVEGLEDMNYRVANMQVDWVKVENPIPVHFWRSVGNSISAFIKECAIDELAVMAGKDPLEFRLNHLGNEPRAINVLKTASEKAGWGSPLPKGSGRGIAYHFSFGSHVVHVAEVSVDEKTGVVAVRRVVSAMDCGRTINPYLVKTQVEGAVIMGMSAALREQVVFENGGVKTANFSDYTIAAISDTPEIEVHILESGEMLGGVGEPGLPPIAPAIANAVYAAIGARIRTLPLTPARVLQAMKGA